MIKIKNYEIGRDVDTNELLVSFACKLYEQEDGLFLFNQTNISDEQYINFAKEMLLAIKIASEIE